MSNTGFFTTLNNTINPTDLGQIFVDCSNSQTIAGKKTYTGVLVSSATPSTNKQLVTKTYADSLVTTQYTITNTNVINTVQNLNSISFPVTNGPKTKKSIQFNKPVTITQNNVLVTSDSVLNMDQIFTFGPNSNYGFNLMSGQNRNNSGIWVGGGYAGSTNVMYSYNGINWFTSSSGNALSYGSGSAGQNFLFNGYMWVGVSQTSGTGVMYSYDGINWVGGLNLTANQYYNVAWNGQIWIVLGASVPQMIYSYDGINWLPTGASYSIFGYQAIGWNGYLWLASGQAANTIAYSYNGINWYSMATIAMGTVYSLIWNGTIWVATCTTLTIVYSYNGFIWYASANANALAGSINTCTAIWNGKMWVSSGGTVAIMYSYDGINWMASANASTIGIGSPESIAWNGYMWIAGGGSTVRVAYSYDGINWYPTSYVNQPSEVKRVAWGGDYRNKNGTLYLPMSRVLALGQGTNTIAFSYAGTNNPIYDLSYTWVGATTSQGLSTNTLFNMANAAAWNGYQWIAVGNPVTTNPPGNTMAFSSIYGGNVFFNSSNNKFVGTNCLGNAGNIWTGLGNYIFSTNGNGIGWNGNVWVACGQGGNTLAYSPNGFSWFGLGTGIFSTSGQSVTWNGTYWLATGAGSVNTMAYSTNGITWTGLGNSIFATQANGAVWNGYLWVAVGTGGAGGNAIAFSSNTLNWNGLGTSMFPLTGTPTGYSIAINTSRTLMVASGTSTTKIAYSSDGIFWTASTNIPIPSALVINNVGWSGKAWIVGGYDSGPNNTMAYSFDANTWATEGNNIFNTLCNNFAWNAGVGSAIITINYTAPTTVTNPLWVIAGQGGNTLAYSSNDGQTWTGLTNNIFSVQGNCVAYSPSGTWVALGSGTTNTIAYSNNGTTWNGLGKNIFTSGNYTDWNGQMWVAGGQGGNTLAYSYNGTIWTGAGTTVFSAVGTDMAWSGQLWVATGIGGNTLAYSYDGINWSGLGASIFTTAGYTIGWNGIVWVASGQGTNTLAYSYNGLQWIGLGTSIFSTIGYDVVWNGSIWVAVGLGLNAIAWSTSGISASSWTGLGVTTAATGNLTTGYSIAWSGKLWIASGVGTSGCTVNSPNGKLWFAPTTTNTTMTNAYGIAYSNYFTNKLVLDNNGASGTQTLDVVADSYFQSGYNRMMVTFVPS